jgi:hypothetical protein
LSTVLVGSNVLLCVPTDDQAGKCLGYFSDVELIAPN